MKLLVFTEYEHQILFHYIRYNKQRTVVEFNKYQISQ